MPFGFLKRRKPGDAPAGGAATPGTPAAAPPSGAAAGSTPTTGTSGITHSGGVSASAGAPSAAHLHEGGVRGVQFTAITEDWRLRGRMQLSGRLTDALNKREAIVISDVTWGPSDGSAPMEPAPGIKSVDPYDLILVIAGEDSLPPLTEAERSALKVHKVPYDVALELPPFRIIGTVFMHPGSEPDRLLDRSNEMFTPSRRRSPSSGTSRSRTPTSRSSSSTGSTCGAWSRSTGRQVSRHSACPAPRWAARASRRGSLTRHARLTAGATRWATMEAG